MKRLLNESGLNFSTSGEEEIVRDIKEQMGEVALDYENELKRKFKNIQNLLSQLKRISNTNSQMGK